MTDFNQNPEKQKISALEEKLQELAFFQRLDRELTWVLDTNHVLNIAMDWAMRRTAADAGLIALRQGELLTVVRLVGASPSESERLTREGLPISSALLSQVTLHNKPLHILDHYEDKEHRPLIHDASRSQLTYPLSIKSEVIGVLHIESNFPKHFTHEMEDFITYVSARTAIALKNATMYDRTYNAEQLKSDMIRMMAHDLRNPLTTIFTALGLLKRQTDQMPALAKAAIDTIDQSSNQMQMLIEELLTLEKLEGAMEESKKPVDLVATLKDSMDRLQDMIERKEHKITLNCANIPIFAKGEATFFRQAMINLISNAVKYTHTGGNITIRLEQHGSRVFFDVKDNGYGISKERQARLFQRFYRANEPTTSHVQGTGLGLSLVKAIVERAKGEVWFESEPDKGSTFGFWLPVTEAEKEGENETQPTKPLYLTQAIERRRARQSGQSYQ